MPDLIIEIAKLSVADRILLVQEILSTIAIDNEIALTTAQKKELDRRSESIKNKTAKTVSWDKIEASLTLLCHFIFLF